MSANLWIPRAIKCLAWGSLFACLPLVCQAQQAQTTVPRPPSSIQQTPTQVPHPPDKQDQQPNPDDQPNATIRVNVKLVNVLATVTNAGGAPVSSLKQDDFQLSEDGVPQQIAVFHRESELPLSIVVAIDTSLSTRGDLKLELES